ncbi:MAG: CYTH domain-containing protein [Clostridiales bacterium]|nr:CYTH domain-containing protein [Clostridiales bacterium]
MEIERKYLINELPKDLDSYPHDTISQAYICTEPVIRILQNNDSYILTLKSGGLLAREEIEMQLSLKSFLRLSTKTDGNMIEKIRYKIPEAHGYLIELDVFQGIYEGFVMAEIEFPDLESADNYTPPAWFGREVTMDPRFHNSSLSQRTSEQVREFFQVLSES